MTLKSEMKSIKTINKWRYELTLSEDSKGNYYVMTENKFIVNDKSTQVFQDYLLASEAFDNKFNNLEGN